MTGLSRRKKKLRAIGKLRRELHAIAKRMVASEGFGIRKTAECCFEAMIKKNPVASFQARPVMNLSAVFVIFAELEVDRHACPDGRWEYGDRLVHKRTFPLSHTPSIKPWLRKIIRSVQERNVSRVMSE